ncbi:MAG: phosphoenolpyruvate--protein phosphotransferase [Treponema sp.]|nr:phosphoenolpyruvate--protein phosphotransferase [Candidatus Treponema caballi]
MNIYKGLSVSPGTGIGKVFHVSTSDITVACRTISSDEKEDGWNRFEKAQTDAVASLTESLKTDDKEQREIFETHLLMLSDPDFTSIVKADYDAASYCIEYAVYKQVEEFASKLAEAGNEFLTERANDIRDAWGRVLSLLTGVSASLGDVPPHAVIVAENLKPSDALKLADKDVAGIVTRDGGAGSHLAILSRAYRIPLVSGIENPLSLFAADETLIVDGSAGKVVSHPDEETLAFYKTAEENERKAILRREAFKNKPCMTKDGHKITLFANIGSPEEAEFAFIEGADGIGLFRTEFLTIAGGDFSEEAQFTAYKNVLQIMGDRLVTIRTLDIGGDKVSGDKSLSTGDEANPLLGWRAIRYCLDNTEVFKTQLHALYRASVYGNLRIMIPMITSVAEVKAVKRLISEVKQELTTGRLHYKDDVPVGIMVETPAAAITADLLAEESAFFSIGSNDLTQYTICVDRENEKVAGLFNEFAPAVRGLIGNTAQAAARKQIPLCVCGEFAGKSEGALWLTGKGITTLSVSPSRITELKELFSKLTLVEINEAAEKTETIADAAEAEALFSSLINNAFKA